MKLRLDLGIYLRAFPLLVRNPSIMALPILAAFSTLVLDQLARLTTDPLGGAGLGIWSILEQLLFGFCFAGAILGASNILRKRPGGFDAMWIELRTKTGAVLLAVVGFYFIVNVAVYIGGSITPILGLILQLVAAFFLIYTIPAAAIGGYPGAPALSASIRCVRANFLSAAILATVFIIVYAVLPPLFLAWLATTVAIPSALYAFVPAIIQAIFIAYLAFPFAATYDDVAF